MGYKKSYLDLCLNDKYPVVAVSDYVKLVSEQISAYVKPYFTALGTDGFGRSDTREQLREFFEINRYYIVITALNSLVKTNKIKTFNLPWGKIGLTICYDLRFPILYRKLAKAGSLFLTVPSAFTETTGRKHWHSLLKARAIENFCYIFAPAQGGTHYNGRKTFGHSLIISPDGEILKELKKSEGVITASVNPKLSKNLRLRIPSLKGH